MQKVRQAQSKGAQKSIINAPQPHFEVQAKHIKTLTSKVEGDFHEGQSTELVMHSDRGNLPLFRADGESVLTEEAELLTTQNLAKQINGLEAV